MTTLKTFESHDGGAFGLLRSLPRPPPHVRGRTGIARITRSKDLLALKD